MEEQSISILEDLSVYTELGTQYTENDVVRYGEDDLQVGVVLEVRTEPFEWPEVDGKVEASEDSPVYMIGKAEGGAQPFEASDLKKVGDEALKPDGDPDVKNPEKTLDNAEMSQAYLELDDPHAMDVTELDIPGVDDPGSGWDDFPDSWEDADRPARLILLDAWTSMGASFDGCVREMRGRMRNPNAFCASMKDEVYGGWTGWRDGGD